jgi:hypothetical protein
MSKDTFRMTAGIIFALVALLHTLRLLLGWEAVIGGWAVPMWFSGLALPLAGYLAYTAFTLK